MVLLQVLPLKRSLREPGKQGSKQGSKGLTCSLSAPERGTHSYSRQLLAMLTDG